MKCEKCGNNEANFIYHQNLNGNVTERHLCHECAGAAGYLSAFASDSRLFDMRSFFEYPRQLAQDMFRPAFAGSMRFQPISAGVRMAAETSAAPVENGCAISASEEIQKRRELNMLREKMRAAAQKDDFETAARLRDEIKTREGSVSA